MHLRTTTGHLGTTVHPRTRVHPPQRWLRWMAITITVALLSTAGVAVVGSSAEAASFGSRVLRRGHSGGDVLELQIRIAGWYSNCAGVPCHEHFPLDSQFGPKTERATKNFQRAYGLPINGVVDGDDYSRLKALAMSDGSTRHFSWSEFVEKKGNCSSSNTGTFNGGKVASSHVRENVRRVMYRLEVLRHRRSGKSPIYIGSGYRSIPYNRCVKGAANSQHMYGAAADGKMKNLHQGHMRGLAKTSEIHAIFCYSSDMHNHLDLRIDNSATGGSFIWPRTNSNGVDLASKDGKVCKGGYRSPPTTGDHPPAEGADVGVGVLDDVIEVQGEDPEGQTMRSMPEEVWMSEDD